MINKQVGDQNGCILILDVNIDKITYVLGIYNGNTEVKQYEIRRFTKFYCKQRAKKDEAERKYLKNKLQNLGMF